MPVFKKVTAIAGFFLITLMSFNVSAQLSGLPDFTHLVEEYSDAVVNISTTQKITKRNSPHGQIPGLPQDGPFGDLFRHFFEQQNYKKNNNLKDNEDSSAKHFIQSRETNDSLGSGFIIDSDGYVVTNHHVIKNADEIVVRLKDRRELKAKVVGSDARSDIALLKIEADNLPVVKIGTSSNLKVGSWVMAIGSPFGFDHSVSVGVISAIGRTLPSESYVPFIQTDVAINPGNSGGPLFNLKGEVIGINSQIYSRTGGFMGLSFAIPVDVAKDIVDQLKSNGQAKWGWLGVLIQDVNKELAESFGMKTPMGAVVLRVMDETPAKNAGIEVGDVITHFGNKTINRSSDLPLAVGQSPIGSNVKVRIIRDGKQKRLTVKIAELPTEDELAENNATKKETKSNRLNIEVTPMTSEQRKRANVDNGLLVQSVDEGPAEKAGIRRGDILLKLNGQDLKNTKQFLDVVKSLPEGKWVRILIQRGGSPRFLPLKLGE
ncbi:MAG: DegQ family serine endoprotease [Gammaproteobacteria bacterium]|nr:DegQ family serine endoprotease [Gammaproteobacteria bacterium]MCW9029873.1 DegQ family serine endoprotease [Gammaproteobacteria bacterium]